MRPNVFGRYFNGRRVTNVWLPGDDPDALILKEWNRLRDIADNSANPRMRRLELAFYNENKASIKRALRNQSRESE